MIKVEEPGKGDYMREIPPIKEHMGWVYLLSNRNKRSITLNLKDSVGAKIFLELVKRSDVVYESGGWNI